MTDEPREPNRPTPERRPPSLGGNSAWYLLILAVGTLFLFSWMDVNNHAEITFGDLVKLIDQGARQISWPPLKSARDRRATSGSSAIPIWML